MTAQQSRLVHKNADFSTLIGFHGNVPWGIKKEIQIVIYKQSFGAKIAKIGPPDPEKFFSEWSLKKKTRNAWQTLAYIAHSAPRCRPLASSSKR